MSDGSNSRSDANPEDRGNSRLRLHLTITRAHPLLLEETESLESGIRSTRILSLASIGLLVERGFFSGELFQAFEDPDVQKALMGFRTKNGAKQESRAAVASTNCADSKEVKEPASGHEKPSVITSNSGVSTEELEPGKGQKLEQTRSSRPVRMP